MLEFITYPEALIAYLEDCEYDCGHACDELQQLDVEYELAHLPSDSLSKYEAICHA